MTNYTPTNEPGGYVFYTNGDMDVTMKSPFSQRWHKATMKATPKQITAWHNGEVIQRALPHLSADEREFLMTGITPDEWKAEFG